MSGDRKKASLPENDYLAILDIIKQFYNCESMSDFKRTFEEHVLPLIGAQLGGYGFAESNFKNLEMVGDGSLATGRKPGLNNLLLSAFQNINQAVIVHEIAPPKSGSDRPPHKRKDCSKDSTSEMVVRDMPEFAVGAVFYRSEKISWSSRDYRIMELLRPHMFQTIKTIALNQQIKNYKYLAETLAGEPVPIALIRAQDMRIVFNNPAFRDLFGLESGQCPFLEMQDMILRAAFLQSDLSDMETAVVKQPYFRHADAFFRVSLYFLKGTGLKHDAHWLLKLITPNDAFSRINYLLQEKGLTGREMEICLLVQDGMDNQEISDRIFISPGTTKTHLQNIYKKLGVCCRTKLIALLKQT